MGLSRSPHNGIKKKAVFEHSRSGTCSITRLELELPPVRYAFIISADGMDRGIKEKFINLKES